MVQESASMPDRFPMTVLPTSMAAAVIAGPRCLDVRSFPAPELTVVRGRLVVAGYHQDGLRQVTLQAWNWKGLGVINAQERDPGVYLQGMKEAVQATAQGVFPLRELLTHRYSLEESSRAPRDIEERPEGFRKGWVRYD